MRLKLLFLLFFVFSPIQTYSQLQVNQTAVVDKKNNNSPYLLIGLDNNVKKIYSTNNGENVTIDLISILPVELTRIDEFTFSPYQNELYLHQFGKSGIFKLNINDQRYEIIYNQSSESINSIVYDDLNDKLYWLDKENGRLHYASTDGQIKSTLLDKLDKPISLAIDPEHNQYFIGLAGERPSILVTDLQSAGNYLIDTDINLPTSIAIDKQTNQLYWSDGVRGTIETVLLNSTKNPKREILLSKLGHVVSLVVKDQMLYWTDLDSGDLNMLNLNDEFKKIMAAPIVDSNKKNFSKKLMIIQKRSIPSRDEEHDDDDDELENAEINQSSKRSMNSNAYTNLVYDDKNSNYIYTQFKPPSISIDPNTFMHSSVRSTEDDSREDVIIDRIIEMDLNINFDSRPNAWHYKRFNSSNYIMIDEVQKIKIWREPFHPTSSGLTFRLNEPICKIDMTKKGTVIQSIFYTSIINYEQVLQFAFIYQSISGEYKLRSFEVTGDSRCLPSYLFDLKNNRPIRLDFISTYQFGSLAVLFDNSQSKPHIEYLKSEHEVSTKLVKVYARQAIDFEPFIVNGFAYLAVAYSNGADVFKFDELISKHRLYESIPIHNIRDLKSFSIGFKNFLAISTSDRYQHIFAWKSGSLQRYQVLNVTNVLQWQIIDLQSCRDDLLLGIVLNNPYNPFSILTWNGIDKHFKFTENIRKYTPHQFAVNPFSQTSFSYNGKAYILEFDQNYRPKILEIHTKIRKVNDPVLDKLHIVSNKIKSLYANFERQQKEIGYVKSVLDLAVRPSQLTVIDGKQKFTNNVDVKRSVDINVISKMKRAIWQGTSLTLNDTNLDLIKAQNEINQLSLRVNNLKSILLNNAVFKDQPSTISGQKMFTGGVSVANKLNSNSIHITKVNNRSLTLLINDLVFKDSPVTNLKGEKVFLSPIDVKGNLDVLNVNNIPNFFEQAAKLNVNQLNFNTPINFVNGFNAKNLDLTGRINNINITSEPIYFDTQAILSINSPSKIIASNTTVQNLNTTTINSVDLLHLYRNSLRTNGNQVMNSVLRIADAVTLANVNVQSNKLNQHNLAFLSKVLVRKDQPAQINSPTTFANSLHLTNHLNIVNNLNSLRIPFDLVSKSRPNLIDGIKHFNGRIVSVNNLGVKGLINEVRYPQDVITLSLPEEISSPIIFENGFTTRKNVHLTGRVDGIKIKEFANYVQSKFSTIPANAQFMGKVFVRNNLIVDGLVNHLNLTSFANNVVIKNPNSTLIISSPKLFRGGLEFRDGFVKELNNLRTSQLMTTNTNQTIYTRLKTAAPVEFDNLFIYNRLINNFDLVNFARNYISIRKPEIIVPNKRFEHVEAAIYLKVKGRINGLSPNQDFVLNDNVGQINSKLRFSRPVTLKGQLNADKIIVKGSFSNLNLNDLMAKRIRLDTNELVDYGVQLAASNIRNLNLIDQKLINGVNFNHLRANLLHKFGNQTIDGQKRFMNLVQFNQNVKSNLINNISMAYIRDYALRLHGDQIIENNVVFHDDVEVGKLNVGRLLNGIDFSYLLRDGIRYDENVYLPNKTIFNAPTKFLGNVIIKKMNGLDLNRDILLRSGNQKVKSNVFVDELLVKGQLSLKSGYLNGQNLFKFENTVLRLDKPNVIAGNLEIDKNVNVLAGTRVQGLINKVNLTKIIHNSLFKFGDQRLNFARIANVPTTFKKLYSFNVNGVNVKDFMNDIVFANSNQAQVINSPKQFKKMVMRGNYYLPDINSICLVNGFDLNEMYTNRIPINSSQPIAIYNDLLIRNNVYLNSDLTIAGRINSIDLIRDAIPLNDRSLQQFNNNLIQNIGGRKQFKNVIFENRLGLKNGNLNGANLNELIESTMHRLGQETIEGEKHFKNRLVFNKLDVFNFNNELNKQTPFLNYQDLNQHSFTFNQPIEILGNLLVTGKVNNVSLNALYQDSLRYSKPQKISGNLKFDELIVTKDAKFTGPLNGIDLKQFLDELSNFKANEKTKSLELNKKIYNGMKLSRDLLKYLEHSTLRIDGLAFHQSLDGVFGNYIKLNPLQIINTMSRNHKFSQLQYNAQRNLFEKVNFNPQTMPRKNFVRREALDDQNDLSVQIPALDSNETAIIRNKRSEQVATIGRYVDQVHYLDLNNGELLIGSLSAIYGKLDLRILTKNPSNQTSYLRPIGSIQVGPMATNFAMFQIENEIYLAVSRSFRNMCPLQDSGSFLFHWENRRVFRLIQRINLPNANNVIYYNFNDQHYLVFSNQRSLDSGQYEDENLYIYRKSTDKSDCQFVLFQKLPFNDVEEYLPFTYGSIDKQELYLVAISVHKLILWKHGGQSGFTKYWIVDLVNGKSVKPVLFNNQLFFIVAQDHNCRGSYVFRAITRGIAFKPIHLYYGQQFSNQIISIPEF